MVRFIPSIQQQKQVYNGNANGVGDESFTCLQVLVNITYRDMVKQPNYV